MRTAIRARTQDVSRRRGSRDEAAAVKTTVTRYHGRQYTAERDGDDLVIFITQPAMERPVDPLVDPARYGVNYGPKAQERQATADRAAGGFIGRLNQKHRDFWARQNGGGR